MVTFVIRSSQIVRAEHETCQIYRRLIHELPPVERTEFCISKSVNVLRMFEMGMLVVSEISSVVFGPDWRTDNTCLAV